MTPIERAARALLLSEDYKRQARAVIESLREPPSSFVQPRTGCPLCGYDTFWGADVEGADQWRTMIDAILNEDDEGIRP